MKFNYYVLLVFLLLVIPMSMAFDDSFKQNGKIFYNKPCLNAPYCSSSANCNITISDPETIVIVNNQKMNNNGVYHNFSLPALSKMGGYNVVMACIDGSLNASNTFTFEVTADGFPSQDFPTQLIFLIFGYVMIIVGLYMKEIKIVKYIGSVIILVMGVITLFPGYSYINSTNLTGLALGVSSIGLGFFFLLYDFLEEDK